MATDEAALLAEANRINYRLRSTFFYRRLKEYNTLALPPSVVELYPVESLYFWDDRTNWGVGEDAFAYVSAHTQLHLIQVFCHPRLLREHPKLLAYYRNIAALSQKGVQYLVGIDVKRFEADTNYTRALPEDQAYALARLCNEHISLIVDSSIFTLTGDELRGLLLISTGAQIDGSWRNAIGEEAEMVVQRLLLTEARERGNLAALISRTGAGVEQYDPTQVEEQLGKIERYRGIMLAHGASILFASDPDVSLLNPDGTTAGVIEVKGGADPAGALERYGAAKKSFEAALKVTPSAQTILVAR